MYDTRATAAAYKRMSTRNFSTVKLTVLATDQGMTTSDMWPSRTTCFVVYVNEHTADEASCCRFASFSVRFVNFFYINDTA